MFLADLVGLPLEFCLSEASPPSKDVNLFSMPLDRVESALGSIEDLSENSTEKAESFEQKLVDKTSYLGRQVEMSVDLLKTVKPASKHEYQR